MNLTVAGLASGPEGWIEYPPSSVTKGEEPLKAVVAEAALNGSIRSLDASCRAAGSSSIRSEPDVATNRRAVPGRSALLSVRVEHDEVTDATTTMAERITTTLVC